jgi:signal transduction histidine kinase
MRKEFADELSFSGIAFDLSIRAPKAMLRVDCAKMKRVAGNIIGNSAKHVPHPGGKIVCTVDADKQNVFFRFADNGDGVPEDKLALIFEPLYTSDTSRKVAGLGLSITKEIVEAHGGSITASRAEIGGLEICITLPRTNK